MAFEVFGFEAGSLGGEAVGPTQDGQLLAERSGGSDESFGWVVGARALHEPDLEVQSRQSRGEIGGGGGESEPIADGVGHASAQRVVGDEDYSALVFAARQRFGDVVEQGRHAQVRQFFGIYLGFEAAFFEFIVDAPDGLQDVIQDIQVMIRPLSEPPREREFGDQRFECGDIQRGTQRLVDVR